MPAGQLYDAALDVARGFLNMSRYVLATQKQVASRWLEVGGEETAEYSIKAFALCFATPFPNEAMTCLPGKTGAAFLNAEMRRQQKP